ncbi:MAG: protoglobin domain-containing protein [Hyphomicrobiales bacterium]|nr:protoglobin domain-containing protein [Hyphomicrobiales bacterium]
MDQQITKDVRRFAGLLGLDAAQLEAAKAAWAEIEPHMPDLIEAFYAHLFANDLHIIFEGRDLPRLKAAQLGYWSALFAGGFDAAYKTHVVKINVQHYAAGVDLSDYIAAYAWFSERFADIIARCDPPKPFERNDLLMATNKVIYLDMMIAAASLETTFLD